MEERLLEMKQQIFEQMAQENAEFKALIEDKEPKDLGDIAALVAFLGALTGETAHTRPLGRPARVPSGLPVD